MKQVSSKIVSLIFSVLVICFVMAFYVLGWTEPSTDAPAVNVYAPINASSIEQRKLGTLRIAGLTADGETHLAWDSGSVGIGTTSPNTKLQVAGGDVYTSTAGNGLILKSPNGLTCKRVGIDNAGNLITTAVACP